MGRQVVGDGARLGSYGEGSAHPRPIRKEAAAQLCTLGWGVGDNRPPAWPGRRGGRPERRIGRQDCHTSAGNIDIKPLPATATTCAETRTHHKSGDLMPDVTSARCAQRQAPGQQE